MLKEVLPCLPTVEAAPTLALAHRTPLALREGLELFLTLLGV